MDYEDELVCEGCGCEETWEYIGEAYDGDVHMGSMYRCLECGHEQCDLDADLNDTDYPDPTYDDDFENYEDFGYDYNDI